jgi:hypothetical protein
MTTAPALYSQLEALDRERHRELRLNPASGYRFAGTTISAAIVCAEFAEAAHVYPIVFVPAADATLVQPVAALGVRNDENLFIDAEGRWDAAYVPAIVRRYPFTAAPDADNKLVACVDAGSGWLSKDAGERLFSDTGEPTQLTKDAIAFLDQLQSESGVTQQFGKLMKESGLLQEMESSMPLADGSRLQVSGFQAVNEQRLRELPEAKIAELFKNGALALIYLHLFSLHNFQNLMIKAASRPAPATAANVVK